MLKPGEAAAIRDWLNTTTFGGITMGLVGGVLAGVLAIALGSGMVVFISAFVDLN